MDENESAFSENLAATKLKAVVEGSNQFIDFADLYVLLEQYSLEEIIEAWEKKYPAVRRSLVPKALMNHSELVTPSTPVAGPAITIRDLTYRFKKAIQEPKRIFETVAWERQTVKKAKANKPSTGKSRGKGLRS